MIRQDQNILTGFKLKRQINLKSILLPVIYKQ